MRLTARVRVGTVDAALLVVRLRVALLLVVGPRHEGQCLRWLNEGGASRLHERRSSEQLLLIGSATSATPDDNTGGDEPEGPHFLTDWITKVAGGKRH